MLAATVYADGGTVSYLVNRQSERKQLTDQNDTVHAYGHDFLARPTTDSITALGAGVDGSVLCILCIGRTYDVRGNLEHVTSFSDAAGTNVVNDILRAYNSFEQCVNEYQEHNGAVNTSTSAAVGYQYADGSANTIRRTARRVSLRERFAFTTSWPLLNVSQRSRPDRHPAWVPHERRGLVNNTL